MFNSKPQKSGVIGLGIIGTRIAEVLRSAGVHVYVWSRTPKSEPNFLSAPSAVTGLAELVQIFVRNGEDLLEVVGEMKGALTKKHIVLNHSTVSLDATRRAADLVAESEAGFLDAPFTGSKDAAADGNLVYYVSGSSTVLAKARPLLELSSREILHVSDTPGDATVLKIATNMISAATVEVLAESLAVTRAHGIAGEKFAEALLLNACNSPLIDMKLSSVLAEDFSPHFSLKNMFKDAQFALELANNAGIELPALSTTAGIMFNAIRNGRGDDDYSVIAADYDARAAGDKSPE